MVEAMPVGMVVLHPVWMFVLGAAGLMHNPYTGVLIMATNLTAPPRHGGLIAAARH